jgi:23S rRNA (uracil1939-C5)-methyltransferase
VRDQCGGCQLQHVDTQVQLESRRSFVGDALRRIAKRDVTDPPIVPADKAYDYRTKLTLHAAGNRIGLHRYGRPDQLFDLEWCHITMPELMKLWQIVRGRRASLPPSLSQLVLRLDRQGGQHLHVRVGEGEVWSSGPRFHRELRQAGAVVTLWYEPPGGVARAVAGSLSAFPATVFEQVFPDMGDKVREFAIRQLGQVTGRSVWDLYAGIGETTALLAGQGAEVQSVELDRRAVAEAESRGPAATRLAGRVEDLLGRLRPPELVIANPPRSGMAQAVTAKLRQLKPKRMVYISCDPATLARDLQRLETMRLVDARAFDLFPQTTHVETVAVLEPQ